MGLNRHLYDCLLLSILTKIPQSIGSGRVIAKNGSEVFWSLSEVIWYVEQSVLVVERSRNAQNTYTFNQYVIFKTKALFLGANCGIGAVKRLLP